MGAGHDITADTLTAWLAAKVPGFHGPARFTKFAGGQSNPTYRVDARSDTYVLRCQPPGPLLASAHQVNREFRVMAALADTPVPVPKVIAEALPEDLTHRARSLRHAAPRGPRLLGPGPARDGRG